MKGIDIASHQGIIDWDKVKSDGIEFAIIRIGIGSDIPSQDDTKAVRNMTECERLGIPYGVYLYSYALSNDNAISEAIHMDRVIKGHNPELGCWFDMEDADSYKRKHGINPYSSKRKLTDFCLLFMRKMKELGHNKVGVYASYDYFKNVLFTTELRAEGDIWLAHWGISQPSIPCSLWQYSSSGTVNGIKGRVDMDIAYITVDETNIEYYPKYIGDLPLAAALNSMGIDGSYNHRKEIASKNGINEYKGSFDQNIKMYNLLKEGKLIK